MATPVGDSYSTQGGVIAAGRSVKTPLQLLAEGMAPGSVVEFTNSSLNTIPSGEAVPPWNKPHPTALEPLDWACNMPWDSTRHQVYCAGGRDYADPTACKLIKFDAKTNTWSAKTNPWNHGGGHLYDSTTMSSELGLVFYVPYGNDEILVWDIEANAAAASIPIPHRDGGLGGYFPVTAIEWHPKMGTQGALVWYNNSYNRTITYDWVTKVWVERKLYGVGPNEGHSVALYLHGAEIVLCGESFNTGSGFQGLNIIDKTGAWSSTAVAPAGISCNGPSQRGPIVSHPDGHSAILFSGDNQHIYQWIAATDTWVDRGLLPNGSVVNTIFSIGTSIPEYGVVMFVVRENTTHRSFLYKPGF